MTQLAKSAIVAVYPTHESADAAIRLLQKDGFDMTKLSVVGRDYHTDEHVVGYYNAGDRMKYWGKQGAFWGGLWGLMFGSAFFWVPGIGPLLLAGPLVAIFAGMIEGAVVTGGMSALAAALFSIGIPKDSVLAYESEIKTGKMLLVASGTSAEIELARTLLGQSEAILTTVHEPIPVIVAEMPIRL